MMLLTPEIREALCANDHARRVALAKGEREPDPIPVIRFFNPVGQATIAINNKIIDTNIALIFLSHFILFGRFFYCLWLRRA